MSGAKLDRIAAVADWFVTMLLCVGMWLSGHEIGKLQRRVDVLEARARICEARP